MIETFFSFLHCADCKKKYFFVGTNAYPISPLLYTHHCTHCNAFTLTSLCAFYFPILTTHVGIPAYLITSSHKRFYLIVVLRRSIINVISGDRRIFEIPRETLFFFSFVVLYNGTTRSLASRCTEVPHSF